MLDDISIYHDIILEKLKLLERKLQFLAYSSKEAGKLDTVGNDLKRLRELIINVKNQNITWDELASIGIFKRNIIDTHNELYNEKRYNEIEDFSLLSGIQKLTLTESFTHSNFINELYSIMLFLNQNYQVLFTQKSLLLASKTSSARERFYLQHQEIERIFKNYAILVESKKNSDSELLIHKEYSLLIKKIILFLEDIKGFLIFIKSDSIFSESDIQTTITSTNHSSSIDGLTLETGLAEFSHFIEESLAFIRIKEKDLYDTFSSDDK